MPIHAATVAKSARLRRVLAALEAEGEITSFDLTLAARTVAVGTCVSELRANGYGVACRQEVREGRRVWLYRLTGRPAPTPDQNPIKKARNDG